MYIKPKYNILDWKDFNNECQYAKKEWLYLSKNYLNTVTEISRERISSVP